LKYSQTSYIIHNSWFIEVQTMIIMTSVEAQNSFGKLLDTVQREAVAITRHGRPTAFVVSPRDMEEILAAKRRRSEAVADFEAWRAEAEASTSAAQKAAAATLTDEDVVRMVHELR
jgi:prevent-host-death family protein